MIIAPVLLGMLLLEEILHRLNRGTIFTNVDLAGESVEHVESGEQGRLTRILSWIRLTQLFLFGFLFAYVAASSGVRLMYTPAGQLSGLLLLTQVVRILNRKVINQWAVLGVAVVLQGLLLVLLILTGLGQGGPAGEYDFPGRWAMSLASFSVLFILTVTVPFAITYYLRLIAREGSGFYYFLPPLIYSEYWIRRLTRVTANLALAVLLLLTLITVSCGYPLAPAIVHMTTVLVLFPALTLFRNSMRLHHPGAVSLVLLAWLLRLGLLLFEAVSPGNGWIG